MSTQEQSSRTPTLVILKPGCVGVYVPPSPQMPNLSVKSKDGTLVMEKIKQHQMGMGLSIKDARNSMLDCLTPSVYSLGLDAEPLFDKTIEYSIAPPSVRLAPGCAAEPAVAVLSAFTALGFAAESSDLTITVDCDVRRLVILADRSSVTIRRKLTYGCTTIHRLDVTIVATNGSKVVVDQGTIKMYSGIIYSGQASFVRGFLPIGPTSDHNKIYCKDSGIVSWTDAQGHTDPLHEHLAYTKYQWLGERSVWIQDGIVGSVRPVAVQRAQDPRTLALVTAVHRDMLSRVLGIPLQDDDGDDSDSSEVAVAIAQSLTSAPASGRRRFIEETKVEKPIMILKEDPGSSEEEVEPESKDAKKRKKSAKETPKRTSEDGACVLCLQRPRTHFSVGCAHLLYCDHCVHKVVKTNHWKMCTICSAPSRGLTYKPI